MRVTRILAAFGITASLTHSLSQEPIHHVACLECVPNTRCLETKTSLPCKKVAERIIAGHITMPSHVRKTVLSGERLYDELTQSVVEITTSWESPFTSDDGKLLSPDDLKQVLENLKKGPVMIRHTSTGSGVILTEKDPDLDPDLAQGATIHRKNWVLPKDDSGGTTILTNCHVIEAKDEAPYPAAMDYYKTNHDIEVTMLIQGLDRHRSASLKRTATLVEAHPDIDICVIATGMIIGGYSVGGIHPIEAIRSFTDLNPGERVFVIGNPKPGKQALTWSLTDGIISALRSENSVDKIQISAPIFHGNSGGALFDEYGNLIGITTEGYIERTQGFNFAIAADLIWARYGQ